jgi:hypothetical protein
MSQVFVRFGFGAVFAVTAARISALNAAVSKCSPSPVASLTLRVVASRYGEHNRPYC